MAKMLNFYDVKSKKKFNSDKWELKNRGGRYFAVTKNPKTGTECWRTVGADITGKKPKGKK